MDIIDLQKRALEINSKYDQLSKKKYKGLRNGQSIMAGFVGDVGDLSKIIMAKHGLRGMDDVDNKLAHELSDCLWSVLVLAKTYDIELESEFIKVMNELDDRIDLELK